jgi:4-amino-4-deoxy-L-arabinose transferase-like glycosyltransferase
MGHDNFWHRLFQTAFVGTMPGTTILILYSGSSLLYMAMAAASVALTLYAFTRDSRRLYVLCGALYGLTYLARLDGLILFGLLGIYLLLSGGRVGRHQLLLMALGFIIAILPWQLYLYANGLYFSKVIQGGWGSAVWVDGPMKYIVSANGGFQFHADSLPNILSAFSKNVWLYTQHIGSIRVFPFFYMAFIGFVFLSREKLGRIAIICLPVVATLPYLLFYVEARYLAPAALFLAVLAAIGLSNMIGFLKAKSAPIYLALICLNLVLVVSYLIFGHETYAPYR